MKTLLVCLCIAPTVTDGVGYITPLAYQTPLQSANALERIAHRTGWIPLGDLTADLKGWLPSGPTFEIISRTARQDIPTLPRVGERIRIVEEPKGVPIVILKFATDGDTDRFEAPTMNRALDMGDYTGLRILPGEVVEVADVAVTPVEVSVVRAAWARVVPVLR